MTTIPDVTLPPEPEKTSRQELTDHMLDAVARAERAEAAYDLTRVDLGYARHDRDLAIKRANTAEALIEKIRTFHDSWRITDREDIDQQVLWEDLHRILNSEPAPRPCPECANGKCANCVSLVPDGRDYEHLTDCPCKTAGHPDGGVQ